MSETKQLKKLTVVDLLKEKEKYSQKSNVTEELYIERLDATITIQKPSRSLVIEAQGIEKTGDSDIFLIYNTVTEPNLKDSELQKAFDCKEPTEIVEKLFSPGEIVDIAQQGLKLAGYSDNVKRVKDLKN